MIKKIRKLQRPLELWVCRQLKLDPSSKERQAVGPQVSHNSPMAPALDWPTSAPMLEGVSLCRLVALSLAFSVGHQE